MKHLQFWFDFASTYSYPAAMQLGAEASSRLIAVSWQPFLLGPIFQAQGWTDSPFNIYPAKGHYMWVDLERICHRLGIPFKRPSVFPRNGVTPLRIAHHFSDQPWISEFIKRTYLANFVDDLDISKEAIISELLQELGQDSQEILSAILEPPARDSFRNQTRRAIELGIFGAPTFVVGQSIYWGWDRLNWALEEAASPVA